MRGDSVNQRIKLDELHVQRTALLKEVQELRTTLEDQDLRLEEMTRSPPWKRESEVRGSLQLLLLVRWHWESW